MKIDYPRPDQIPGLRSLWKLAFDDTDAFLDKFFGQVFSPDRCRCLTRDGEIAAALYWFRCEADGKQLAYLYAVATHPDHRRKGLCRSLLEDTHTLLKVLGYDGVLLVPQEDALRRMYEAAGYRTCSTISEFPCTASSRPAPLHPIDREEYARLRRQYLPKGGVIQEGESLVFLETYASFYSGPAFLLAACPDGQRLRGIELLGDPSAAPEILRALGCSEGIFRTPGTGIPFAMFCPLDPDAAVPGYFGLALD